MPTQVQLRRGTSAQTAVFTGAVAEITVNTDENYIVIHDGVTSGGHPASTLAFAQAAFDVANTAFGGETAAGEAANAAYAHANAAFDSANNVFPQIQPTANAANAAFAHANAAYVMANSAYASQNTTYIYANAAFTEANTAYQAASDAYNFATDVHVYSEAGYAKANSANVLAQNSFDRANTKVSKAGDTMTGDLQMTANIIPTTSNTYYLGSIDKVWHSLFVGPGSINIDGVVLGNNNGSLSVTSSVGNPIDLTFMAIMANGAYDKANSANVLAQTAYNSGNTTLTYSQSGFGHSNAAFIHANNSYDKANSANVLAQDVYNFGNTTLTYAQAGYSHANAAFINSNSAYNQANTGTTLAQAAFDSANNVTPQIQPSFNQANAAFDKANSSYVHANSAYDKANTGGTLTGATHITDTTQSTTDSNGALIVDGGVGIAKNLNVGGSAIITGSLTVVGGTVSTASSTVTYENPYITLHDPVANSWITSNDGVDIGIQYEYYDPVGASFVITGGSGNGTTATLTLSDRQVTPVGEVIQIAGVTPSGFNGSWIVTASSVGSVSFLSTTTGSVDTTGRLGTAERVTQITLSGGTWSSQYANASFSLGSTSATLPVGKWVTITGCTPDRYNGTYQVATSGPGWFRYDIGNPNPGPMTVMGVVTLENRHAFSGWANDTGYFEFYKSGAFDATGSFGGLYGGLKAGKLVASPPQSITAADLTAGGFIQVPPSTVYDATTASGNTVAQVSAVMSLGVVTVGAANTNVTYTNSATLYIAGSPLPGNNVTMSGNTYSLEVASGKSWFGGDVEFHTANGIAFYDGSKQSTAAAPYAYSNASYAQANSATTKAEAGFIKANGAVQTGFTTITANGNSITPSSNTDTLTITAATANGINVLNPSSKTIDIGLRTSGVTSGTYGGSTNIPVITTDAFGRVTSAANVAVSTTINLAGTSGTGSVSGGGTLTFNGNTGISTYSTGSVIYINNTGVTSLTTNSSSRITQSGTTGAVTFDLATTGVTANTYSYPSIQVDSYGRVTSISTQTAVSSWNGLTGDVTLSSANVTSALGFTPANKAGDTLSGSFTGINNLGANTITLTNGAITTIAYTTTTTSQNTIDSFPTTTYRTADYQVSIKSGSSYHITEMSVLHDGTTVWMDQYSEVFTGSSLGSFDATIVAGDLNILFTPTNASTTVKMMRKAINV
jgi:hypothetical protein